jgi:hypothetical protein
VTKPIHALMLAAAAGLAIVSAGCANELARSSQSPTQLVLDTLLVARSTSAATPTTFVSGPLISDIPGPNEGYFNDYGQATIRSIRKDVLGTAPSDLNRVTITRYRIVYRRSDGLNTPGVHVPQPVDGAVTATLPPEGTTVLIFELVRHNAKVEPPLAVLGVNPQVLTTIAEVTFFGRDQAANEVSVSGLVQINFGSFN